MSIADKITQLTTIRTSMREKLVAKGVAASTHNFADFPNDVDNLSLISKTVNSALGYFTFNGVDFITNSARGHFQPLLSGSAFSLNFNSYNEFRICVKARVSASATVPAILYANNNNWYCSPTIMVVGSPRVPYLMLPKANSATWQYGISDSTADLTDWNYYVLYFNKTANEFKYSIYNTNKERKGRAINACPALANYAAAPLFGGCINGDTFNYGDIDILQCFIETEDTLLWGNSQLQNTNIGKEE